MDAVSLSLWAANEELLKLRAQTQSRCKVSGRLLTPADKPESSDALRNAQADLGRYRQRDQVRYQPVAGYMPEMRGRCQVCESPEEEDIGDLPPRAFHRGEAGLAGRHSRPESVPQSQTNNWVKLYPDIGLGMLREGQTAPGRLWLLLQHLDPVGCGTLRIDIIVQTLTPKPTALHLCGKRQLRNLLRAGEGIFWVVDRERVWLRSAAKVAAHLGVTRLTGKPVSLPLSALLHGIGDFRAHLYAAFHSGRTKETPQGRQAMPLARATLANLSGVGASSQRSYETRVGLTVQANYAIGDGLTAVKAEKRAWQQGTAVFQLRDYHGQQGQPGRCYLAWQLPNSYVGPHPRRPKGRQKRINRALKDLVTKGTPGNIEETGEAQPTNRSKRYYALARDAVRVASRKPGRQVYWRETGVKGRSDGNGRFTFWQRTGMA